MDNNIELNSKNQCKICYTIICKQCGWAATDEDMDKIQKKVITSCPICGWSPS